MDNKANNVDQFFKEALGGFRKEPSASVWANLENRFFPSGGNGRTMIFTVIATALIILGTGITTYIVLSHDRHTADNDLNIQNLIAQSTPITINSSYGARNIQSDNTDIINSHDLNPVEDLQNLFVSENTEQYNDESDSYPETNLDDPGSV